MTTLSGSNEQKTPLALSLQKLGKAKAADAIQALGKGLPCTVAKVISPGVVVVNFYVASMPAPLAQVEMPVNKTPYIDYPIQVGDIGIALSTDLRSGGLTGLGIGTPSLTDTVGNLSSMHFFWLGKLSEVFLDPAALALYQNILCTPTTLSFFGGTRASKQTVTGVLSAVTDSNAKAVITSIIHALSNYNLVVNGTT